MIRGLEIFLMVYGFGVNKDKFVIYFDNVKEYIKDFIKGVIGFVEDKLCFKYFGVFLIIKRYSVIDCDIFVEKIVGRVKCWGFRYIFYVVRV